MMNSPLDILYLFYIAITQSAFMQVFTILVFYGVSKFYYAPKKNWYYPDKDES